MTMNKTERNKRAKRNIIAKFAAKSLTKTKFTNWKERFSASTATMTRKTYAL